MSKGFKKKRDINNFGIPSLYIGIPVCVIVSYLFALLAPELHSKMLLSPYFIFYGHEYWRFFTWIFTIPYSLSAFTMIFLPISLYFYYSLGKALERLWGRFTFNLYVLGGIMLTDLLVMLGSLFFFYYSPSSLMTMDNALDSAVSGAYAPRYILISIFLAFTIVGGDNMVYLYFIIPLKMKWLGYVDLILLFYEFMVGGFFTKIIVFSSVFNFFVYALITRNKKGYKASNLRRNYQRDRGKSSKTKVTYNSDGTIRFPEGKTVIPPGYGNPEGITIHKCAVCGRSEKDDPNLEFRFCSKCDGNYEYCSEHLYTHEHVHK